MRTFVDAGVLIVAARGTAELSERALEVLGDSRREFVTSVFLQLEVLPKPSYFGRAREVDFYEAFFTSVSDCVPASAALADHAFTLACRHGLAAMDALHIAAALAGNAVEFVTTERGTSPLFRIEGIAVASLLEEGSSSRK
jgi:predicted nucleic acid-binding protein